MKIKISQIIILTCFLAVNLNAQSGTVIVGGGAVYSIPIGSFGNRFVPSSGWTIYAGKQIDEDIKWLGKFEYCEFKKVNTDKTFKKVTAQINGLKKEFVFPLSKLGMNFKSVGISAEMRYNILRESFIESDLGAGFGFYNWKNYRGAYFDSLFADTSGTGQMMKVAVLAVPENKQVDWSGTLNVSLSADIKIYEPLWLNIALDYKLIIGELWQSLALDIENVSGIQTLNIRAGFQVYL